MLLNGSGFARRMAVRISFANWMIMFTTTWRAVRAIARGYRLAYEAATGKSAARRASKAPRQTLACVVPPAAHNILEDMNDRVHRQGRINAVRARSRIRN